MSKYALSYEYSLPEKQFKDYENIQVGQTFNNINELMSVVGCDKNVIVHFVNGNSGFGSQLTIFMQNLYYFHENYPDIICLPSFSNNSEYFKYHESSLYNNSFFLYFNRIKDIDDLSKYKQYFLLMGVINDYPFFGYGIPAMNHEPGRKYIQHFNKNYEFIANTEIIQIFQNIKKNAKIFGIHIRSLEQKRVHHNDYLAISIQDRLHRVKGKRTTRCFSWM